ncbi:MAG: DoxX family protein [Anaerolineales bacterium]|nr:DoxX family protein [Anaerolineales bacterium]MCB8951668.1 DoxX family protein [Ardenticatenales bacterium]
MNTALWIVQGMLAVAFLMAGGMKATQPIEKIRERLPFAEDFAERTVRVIGILEVLAAVGLILPPITKILPILTPLAGVGLVLTMIGAIITHVRRGEYSAIVANVVLLLLAAFVAYGRFVIAPF